jgi:redox-sensitive bicupin YhaK (pirin superfamily)
VVEIRRADERGYADHGWLKSYHSFSFAAYFDPEHMGFGPLRVINEDRVAGGAGFGPHPHKDMEIISYVLSGSLEHRDTMGTGSVIRAGDVQRMSAGSGVLHSEYNHSPDEPVHFLQIWIEPDRIGIAPEYEQTSIAAIAKRGNLRLVASPDGRDESMRINADALMFAAMVDGEERLNHELAPGRKAYLQVVSGGLTANGAVLESGDAVKIRDETHVFIEGGRHAELLLFDLP